MHIRQQNHPLDVAATIALVTGLFACGAGLSAIVGWVFDLPRLTDWANQGISMFPNAALCGLLCGLALLLLTTRAGPAVVVRALAGAAVVVSCLTLFEHLTGVNLGVDTLLVRRPWGQAAAVAPMRMGVPASTAYSLLGSALILGTLPGGWRTAASLLGMLAVGIASLSLTGYLFGADQLFGIAKYSGIALMTSAVIAALGIGVMAGVGNYGLAAALRRDDAGGDVIRRLLIPILIIPLFLGWLRILGQRAGYYDLEFGAALRTLVECGVFFVLLWWTANRISFHAASAQKAQARLAAIVETSEDAIMSKSLQGIIESWNAGAQRIYGYTPAEVIGKHISIIIPPERIDEETDILARLRRGQRIDHFETVRIRKDGTRIAISLSVSPIKNADGQIVGASKIAHDVSDQRRAEQRLRAIVEATPECVTIATEDGTLEYINRAGLAMIEAESEADVQGSSALELVAPEQRAQWAEYHRRVCAGERLTWEFELVGANGARHWMEAYAVPLPLPDGRAAQLAVSREITLRKNLERERAELLQSERAARAEAERASHLKDEFLATLSHELRTPLNAILGWSQVLHLSSDEADLKQGLEAIQRNARAQAQLIEDLLDMSRIISGKLRLDVQPTDLAAVIQAAVESIGPAADAKEIAVRKILDPNAGTVSGDPTRLQQVVWNLLTNAVKFTPKGGKVDVVLERVNSHVEISVRDSGIGISADDLPIIFERFRQVDSSTTRAHGGLGLGLSIVKHLVELHGGTIAVKSAGQDQGAMFVVSLPVSPVRASQERRHPTSATSTFDCGNVDLGGVKVLVVDDEADSRALLERVLRQCGAEVSSAESAEEGLNKLRAFRPDVLVSDIGMPVTDGYQFLRTVRGLAEREGGRTPAIALTAFARSEDRMRAMLAGYQVHVAKPIEPQELLVTVHTLSRRMEASV